MSAEPTTEKGRVLASDILGLAEAFHQVGSLRDHADPNDRTGWNLHGIETCEDAYCRDALSAGDAIVAIEAEAAANERARLLRAIEDIPPQVGAEALLSEVRKVFKEGGTDR